jgi:rubredoxin
MSDADEGDRESDDWPDSAKRMIRDLWEKEAAARRRIVELEAPIPMRLLCPSCGQLHIDEGEFETKPHHTHACQLCGHVWRPAIVSTVGVQFLPGFKNK